MKVINKTLDIWIWPLTAVLIFLALQFISVFVIKTAVFMAFDESSSATLNIAPWSMLVSSLLTILVLTLLKPFKLFKEFRIWICDNWNALIAFLIALLAIFGANAMNELLEKLLGMQMDSEYRQLYEDVIKSPVGLFAVVVAGPVCEEIVFRAGIMKPMIDRNVKPWIPIVVSAGIFGLVHGNIAQMIYATAIGLVFAVVYHRTRSLLISSFMHILNNLITVTVMVNYDNYEELTFERFMGRGPLIVAFVVTLAMIVVLVRYFWINTEKYQTKS